MAVKDAELRERAEARIGSTLRDKWHVDELIGLGGMAAVYAATHRNGKRAAIKILHAEASMVPDIRARFLREGYLANRVGHPGAVSILDDDVDVDGTVYLVMELLEGQTLDSFRDASSIPVNELLLIAHGVLDVLAAAHSKNIVHRDLKPANVFLCTSSAVKILDFGIARLQSVAQAQQPSGATGRDVTLGTPGYMPPEQARGHWDKVDGQSDLWSLGATLFALVSGRLVHEAPTVNEQLLAAMTQAAPPLKSIVPAVPAEVARIVDRALAFDKADRWPSARAMQDEVAHAYETTTGKPVERAPPVSVAMRVRSVAPDAPTVAASEHGVARTTARSTRRRREIVVALGGAGVLAAIVAFALTRGGGTLVEEEKKRVEPAAPTPAAERIAAPARPVETDASAAPTAAAQSSSPLGAIAPDSAGPHSSSLGKHRPAPEGTRLAAPPSSGGRSGASAPASSAKAGAPSGTEPDIFVRRK